MFNKAFCLGLFVTLTCNNFAVAKNGLDLYSKSNVVGKNEQIELILQGSSVEQIGVPVTWEVEDHKGYLYKKASNLDVNATATAIFQPDISLKNFETIKIKAKAGKTTAHYTLSYRLYGQDPKDLFGSSIMEYGATTTLTYSNLKPKSIVMWQTSGDLRFITDQGEKTSFLNDEVSDLGISSVNVVATKTGDEYKDQGIVRVFTDDVEFKGLEKTIRLVSYRDPVYKIDKQLHAGNDFEIYLSGLRPNTSVQWTDGDQAQLQLGENGITTYVNDDGVTIARYSINEDAKNVIKNIKARFYGYSDDQGKVTYFDWKCPPLIINKNE